MIKKLCITAHADDVEIMAPFAISECFSDKSFGAVIITDGRGSLRANEFANTTDEQMVKIRKAEQQKAALLGNYGLLRFGGFLSSEADSDEAVSFIQDILTEYKPQTVYIHNLADKHKTHVSCSLTAIKALRNMKNYYTPEKLYMMEVWRSLDWLPDRKKVVFNNHNPDLQQKLLSCFNSQLAGGKRYDLGAKGRAIANAIFLESHETTDENACHTVSNLKCRQNGVNSSFKKERIAREHFVDAFDCKQYYYGIDATELINSTVTPMDFILSLIDGFRDEVKYAL